MHFPASPSSRLGHLRPALRSWLAPFLPSLPLLLPQPRSTEASASRNQESSIPRPGRPPPFLSLPSHPTPFLFLFSNSCVCLFVCFSHHQKPQHPTPLGWIPRL